MSVEPLNIFISSVQKELAGIGRGTFYVLAREQDTMATKRT